MRISGLLLRASWSLCGACLALPTMAAPFAYVTNRNGASLSVIDTATNTVAATIGVEGEGGKALPFKEVKNDGSQPQLFIVLNAQRAGGLGGDGVCGRT